MHHSLAHVHELDKFVTVLIMNACSPSFPLQHMAQLPSRHGADLSPDLSSPAEHLALADAGVLLLSALCNVGLEAMEKSGWEMRVTRWEAEGCRA